GVQRVIPLSSRVPLGASSIVFEVFALKIERLLSPESPKTAPKMKPAAPIQRRTGLFGMVRSPFGRKKRALEEQVRQRDERIDRLKQEHETAVSELTQVVQAKDADIEEKNGVIGNLEDEI